MSELHKTVQNKTVYVQNPESKLWEERTRYNTPRLYTMTKYAKQIQLHWDKKNNTTHIEIESKELEVVPQGMCTNENVSETESGEENEKALQDQDVGKTRGVKVVKKNLKKELFC